MATPQQSLFGMFQSPTQVEQAQQQRLFEQARQSAMMTPEQQGAFIAARSGQMTGRLLSDIAGYEDPALKKARDLQGIANEVKASMSAEDQKDPAKVYAAMAKRASEIGYTQEAMLLSDEANRRSIEERKLSLTERGVKVQEGELELRKTAANVFDSLNLLTSDGRPVSFNKATGAFETIDPVSKTRRPFDPSKDKLEYKPAGEDPLKAVIAALIGGGLSQGGTAPKAKPSESKKDEKKKPAGPLNPAEYEVKP